MKKGNNENSLKINMVKTDKCCFMSDCTAIHGYDWNYHHTKLTDMFFDGVKPKATFSPNWVKIDKYPTTIQRLVGRPPINKRYEIKDENFISDKLPKIIKYEDREQFDDDIFSLYTFKDDKQDSVLEDVECEIDVVFEVENYEMPPVINYKAIRRTDFSDKEFNITNTLINHQLFDKLIFPEVMLHTRPCSISSQNLFALVRQYVKENIDTKVAKITSDYDFCFTVKKIVPLIEPQTVSYQNIFARTKKERAKINYSTKTFKEIEIFEMTHEQSKYNNYTVIQSIFAENEQELKEKIDNFLDNLITIINESLRMCEHCNGSGYLTEVKRIKQSELL